ncbi:MAG: Gfo/Idh/MocA family protein [Alphaproteobacteria bacterium]
MINAAIIGVGRWGQILVNSVQGSSEAIRFTRGVTRTLSKAEAYCDENHIQLGDDYDSVLADESIDAVVLATPHTQHRDQIIRAAEAGKHVFTEKPFALNKADAEIAVAACRKAGVAIGLGHNKRFCDNTIELKRMIEAGELGALMHVETNFSADLTGTAATWRDSRAESPAGGMTSLGIHAVDCIIHLCGEIKQVDARSKHRALPFDIDDTTCMLFDFDNGMTGYLGTMAAGGRLWFLRVFGSKGWAELRGMEELVKASADGSQEVIDYPAEASVRAELEAFAAAAAGGAPYLITPDQMIHGIAVLEAIIASGETGERVTVG